MTEKQIQLVQQSWECVKPVAKQAGLSFYDKLFTAAPGVRHLFKENSSEQAGKLVTMLGFVVAKLNKLEDILADVQKLGARHNQYGAKPEHYDVVGRCLIETLKEGLGDKWNDETEEAWLFAFTVVKTVMIKAQEMTETETVH
jgi:hemoglobin-like flavoprotein